MQLERNEALYLDRWLLTTGTGIWGEVFDAHSAYQVWAIFLTIAINNKSVIKCT